MEDKKALKDKIDRQRFFIKLMTASAVTAFLGIALLGEHYWADEEAGIQYRFTATRGQEFINHRKGQHSFRLADTAVNRFMNTVLPGDGRDLWCVECDAPVNADRQ